MKKETKKEQKKRKNTINIIGLVICIIIGIVILIFLINSSNKSTIGNGQSSKQAQQQPQKSCRDTQVPYDYLEEYQETVPYTDRECETKDLVYSATNDKWNYETCNNWDEVCYQKNWLGICINKTTFCSDKSLSYSVDINNLDEEQGIWTVDINFYKAGNVYKTVPLTKFLYPKTTETFNGVIRVSGDSPSGDANQDYSANYRIEDVPTKQVCRDVTKYKEVTKTRTVTRYRTEQKCD